MFQSREGVAIGRDFTPRHQHRLDWKRTDPDGGNWYGWEEFKIEGWLCPALFKYFEQPPKHIYVQAKAKSV